MNVNVSVTVNAKKILQERGLGSDNKVQKMLANEVARLSDAYVPMQQGMLKNQKTIASDGSSITYNQPYAHYQYYGKVMAGRAPKSYTGAKLNYHGAPMRGAQWTARMVADKSHELEKSVETIVKKRGG